jgi:hypothetical protein
VTAPNHALTGALIGMAVSEPLLAMPLAFLSHFVCDAIPHYDSTIEDGPKRLMSKEFIFVQLVTGAVVCFALVACLALFRPHHWVLAAFCAFLAASPDLFWLPRFIRVLRTHKDFWGKNWFLRFHAFIQWKTGPQFWILEAAWFVTGSLLIASQL